MARKKHKTFFGKIVGPIWDTVKQMFIDQYEKADHNILETAINITNLIKDGLRNGILNLIVDTTKTKVDDDILETVNNNIGKVVVAELLLKEVKDDSTPEQVQEIEKQVVDAFGGLSDDDKEEFYTAVAANMTKLLYMARHGEKITFGIAAYYAERSWQAYKKLHEAETAK